MTRTCDNCKFSRKAMNVCHCKDCDIYEHSFYPQPDNCFWFEERTDSPETLIRDMIEAFNVCHNENKIPYRAGIRLFEQRAMEMGIEVS